MKAFEELFQEAALVADRRTKVLNELVEKTKEDILPKFCKACAGFGLSKVYIRTDSKVYSDSDKQSDERNYFYGICINVEDQEISDALYNPYSAPASRSGIDTLSSDHTIGMLYLQTP